MSTFARLDDLLLLASELVTNVVRHAPMAETVRVTVTRDQGVRVAVTQPATRFVRPEVVSTEPHGRGLAIVEALADEWGVESHPDSFQVWFELRSSDENPTGS